MSAPALIKERAHHLATWNEENALVTLDSSWFSKLNISTAFAARFRSVEGCSYAFTNQIFSSFALATTNTNTRKTLELHWHPQGPFFDRKDPPILISESLEESIPKAERSRRIPDFLMLLSAKSDRTYEDTDLVFWVEVKPLKSQWTLKNGRSAGLAMARAIPQVNMQAAYAFKTVHTRNAYHAFIFSGIFFSLLRYTRPTPSAGSSKSKSVADSTGLVMPEEPEVLYWRQPIITGRGRALSLVFLIALDELTSDLGLTLQPSWFSRNGRNLSASELEHVKKLNEEAKKNVKKETQRDSQLAKEVEEQLVQEDATETPPASKSSDHSVRYRLTDDPIHSPAKLRARPSKRGKAGTGKARA
ncbi:hypothetical protein EVG20_g10029 [Dentipellis fragilis]|uniref:Uncharacterized protein n=1 Tax=Dentipellis fragilis TaxID=205917 RepID=A0A4Y9XYI2_9AGAM|nr:hypothetical protein EVG20_g10029 [Dentipellis fragilis]